MNTQQHNPMLCALFCVLFLLRPNFSQAADIYVDDSAACGGLCDGSNWNMAYPDLQTALTLASAGDNIYVAGGTYYPDASDRDASFVIPSGVLVLGGYDGFGSPGNRNSVSILSGEIGAAGISDNSFTVVFIQNASISTLLDGFTITGGYSDTFSSSNDHRQGAGIYITATGSNTTQPTIRNCHIHTNETTGSGGGIYISGGGFGGTAIPQINDCTIQNNTASLGGGLFNDGNIDTVTPVIISCDFYNNDATATGGAVYNFAKSSGTAQATVTNTIFRDNTASSAGGYYSLASANGSSVSLLTNCTFYSNFASVGGAVYVNEEAGSTTQTTINNAIVWASSAGFDPICHYSGNGTPEIIFNYTLIDANSCNDIKSGTDVTCGSGMIYNQDPQFISAGAGNFDLNQTSPAINAGDNVSIGNTGVSVDIHADSRIQNGMVDLGVDETPFGAMLPVELVDFSVKRNDERSTLLSWQTASELNNDYFTIEHSIDGIRYEAIAQVYGAGTTNEVQFYSYVDHQPSIGLNYYRLKQTDFDGQFSYSQIKTIIFESSTDEPSIFPNPVKDIIHVNLGRATAQESLNYAIYDWAGKQIQQGILEGNYGLARLNLNQASSLSPGMYILKIESFEQSFKFAKR